MESVDKSSSKIAAGVKTFGTLIQRDQRVGNAKPYTQDELLVLLKKYFPNRLIAGPQN